MSVKIRVLDRILVTIAGLLLLTVCAGLCAEAFFGVSVLETLQAYLHREDTISRICVIAGLMVLFVLGGYCAMVLFRHRKHRDNGTRTGTAFPAEDRI